MRSLRLSFLPGMVIILMLTSLGMRPLAPQAPLAATITVTALTDEFGEGSNCSLREAVESAHRDADYGGCSHTGTYGNDTIILGTNTYSATRYSDGTPISEDNNLYGDLDIEPDGTPTIGYDLTIKGNGPANTIISAANSDRVIDIKSTVSVKLVDLKITYGQPAATDGKLGNGAGIYNHGTLYLDSCLLQDNQGRPNNNISPMHVGDGGGIWSDGKLTIIESQFQYNYASAANISDNGGDAGAIYIAAASGNVMISDSTFFNNMAGTINGSGTGGRGGAIFNSGLHTQIERSVFESNFAGQANSATGNGGDGGGIYNYQGTLTITNSTLYRNHSGSSAHAISGSGGGLANNGGTMNVYESTLYDNLINPGVTNGLGAGIESSAAGTQTYLRNTLVAGNYLQDSPAQFSDCHTGSSGDVFEARYSLIQTLDGCDPDVQESNLPEGTDPGIGPFGFHGGPTRTIPLWSHSQAIDAGDPADCPATDQRSYGRPADGDNDGTFICDIGAYELQMMRFLPRILK